LAIRSRATAKRSTAIGWLRKHHFAVWNIGQTLHSRAANGRIRARQGGGLANPPFPGGLGDLDININTAKALGLTTPVSQR
jgi:hypothetical protein